LDSEKGRECRCANIGISSGKIDENLVSSFAREFVVDKERSIIYLAFKQLAVSAKLKVATTIEKKGCVQQKMQL